LLESSGTSSSFSFFSASLSSPSSSKADFIYFRDMNYMIISPLLKHSCNGKFNLHEN
jgi:hypothetical protein